MATRTDPITESASHVLAANPALRTRVTRLFEALLADAEHIIKHGSPRERTALMQKIVPALLASMRSADADAGEAADQAAFQRMMNEMRGDPDGDSESR